PGVARDRGRLRCRAAELPKFQRPAKPPCRSERSPDSGERRGSSRASLGWPSLEKLGAIRRDFLAGAQAAQNLDISIDRLPNRHRPLFRLTTVIYKDRARITFANDRCCGSDQRLMRACLHMNGPEHLGFEALIAIGKTNPRF